MEHVRWCHRFYVLFIFVIGGSVDQWMDLSMSTIRIVAQIRGLMGLGAN